MNSQDKELAARRSTRRGLAAAALAVFSLQPGLLSVAQAQSGPAWGPKFNATGGQGNGVGADEQAPLRRLDLR
jgi:hypothetical protein